MTTQVCSTCQKPKAQFACGICRDLVCKSCAQRVSEKAFAFLDKVSEELTLGCYCISCYDQKVDPALQAYNSDISRAEQVSVFFKKQSKETRMFRRTAATLHVTDCADRDEALLRLAFLAVKANYNML